MEKRKVFLAVLSSRECGPLLRDQTMRNISEALRLAKFWSGVGNTEVTVMFMAGSHRYKSHPTIASCMENYAWVMSRGELTLPCDVNAADLDVWGTWAEVRWAFEKAKNHDTDPHMVFVTSRWSRFDVWLACLLCRVRNRTILVPGKYPPAVFARA